MIRGKNTRYKNQSLRRRALQPAMHTPIVPTFNTPVASSVTMTLNVPCSLSGLPGIFDTSTPTITVTSAVRTTPTTITLGFNAAPTVAITVPFEDPAIRNLAGGFLQAGSYLF